MNLKYYLRGLGIGIIVTALIMSITAGSKESLSNAEIKERAKALGMVEESTLINDIGTKEQELVTEAAASPEVSDEKQEFFTPENIEDVSEASAKPTISPAASQTATPTALPAEEPEAKENLKEPEQGSQVSGGTVTIQIAGGDGSYSVCEKLETAGLVESASAYDQFLYQNGYDKKIRAGTFEIPAGAESETIAKIICGME